MAPTAAAATRSTSDRRMPRGRPQAYNGSQSEGPRIGPDDPTVDTFKPHARNHPGRPTSAVDDAAVRRVQPRCRQCVSDMIPGAPSVIRLTRKHRRDTLPVRHRPRRTGCGRGYATTRRTWPATTKQLLPQSRYQSCVTRQGAYPFFSQTHCRAQLRLFSTGPGSHNQSNINGPTT